MAKPAKRKSKKKEAKKKGSEKYAENKEETLFKMAAAVASHEVEHSFTSVKLLTNEDVDRGTPLR